MIFAHSSRYSPSWWGNRGTVKVCLCTSISAIKMIPHSHAWRFISPGTLDSVTLTVNANHHRNLRRRKVRVLSNEQDAWPGETSCHTSMKTRLPISVTYIDLGCVCVPGDANLALRRSQSKMASKTSHMGKALSSIERLCLNG